MHARVERVEKQSGCAQSPGGVVFLLLLLVGLATKQRVRAATVSPLHTRMPARWVSARERRALAGRAGVKNEK